MKDFRKFALGLVLGIGLALSSIAFAQTTTQAGDAKKDAESCCAMTSCCCKGDSCSMKDHANKDHMKNGATKHGAGCCCGGDSCDVRMKHDKQEQPKG